MRTKRVLKFLVVRLNHGSSGCLQEISSNSRPKKWLRSLTRGSSCSDWTEKILVFKKSGRLPEVVAQEGPTGFLLWLPVCKKIII